MVEFSTPVNPRILQPGRLLRTRLNTGAPSITVDSNRNSTPARRASSINVRVGVRDRPFIRRDHVHRRAKAARMCEIAGSPVAGFSVVISITIFGPRAIQKFFNGPAARPERGLDRQPALVERAAVAQRVNRHDAKRKNLPLRFEQPRKRPPHIAVTDQTPVSEVQLLHHRREFRF